ncbi:hypothetical protein H6G33_12495 [Calothrix sp. FACHB-1219]|uniref:hypothetical protein n=1 Tax=Nostocales TaxID=1161 RepID=UPI0016884327|nr:MULTISPECIES: hypothetical protein [Nostocales]MBD2202559.1 hypothetical protein [Calothrix sp. FACHB-168]MBD2217851.1 hypothetical protein [Calothrix sp. FACHB-1219]MBD2354823.1 hypothetical protein [Tolypothrix sp. FACHB-123]
MPKIAFNKGISLPFLILAFFVTSTTYTRADTQQTPPIFGDVTIGKNFSPDPFTVRGMSGGSIPGNQVSKRPATPTGPCTGFVDEAPDHKLELTSKFDYLKVQVQSPEDTTIIVKGPGGIWCNDELSDGQNPGIAGEWLPGTYQIWVGSYVQDKYLPYTLQITEVK